MKNKLIPKMQRKQAEEASRWLKRYNLARLMDERGWCLDDLAQIYGCTKDYIWQLVRGKVGIGGDTIKKLSEIFQVKDTEFLKQVPGVGDPEIDRLTDRLVEVIKENDHRHLIDEFFTLLEKGYNQDICEHLHRQVKLLTRISPK